MTKENKNAKAPAGVSAEEDAYEEGLSEQRKIRRQKLKDLVEAGRNPYLHETWDVKNWSQDIKDDFAKEEAALAQAAPEAGAADENAEAPAPEMEVSIAGRIMSKRVMGKASFFDIQDKQGRIQCYVRRDDIGTDEYKWFKTYDIGDICGIEGHVFKTRTGEISIHVTRIVLLTKSLQVLPEKWNGLKDPDLRYRQRYVDLIMNKDVRDTFVSRAKIENIIREVLEKDYGFLEVTTPILQTIAGGAAARPFITHHNALDIDMYLRIATELYLKRCIVGGLDRVYEMGPCFRNEGMDQRHNPEYTSMECYMSYGNLDNMMDITEQIVYRAQMAINGTPIIKYGEKEFDVTPPWRRLDMTDAVIQVTGIDFNSIETDEDARKAAIDYGMDANEVNKWTRGKIIAEMFEDYAEEYPGLMDGPCFLMGHPVEISPLAKRDPKDPRITRRFEAYINGWEIGNAFSELNDPIDQYERFVEQQKERDTGLDDEAHPMDMDFVNALEVGMPPTGGLGIGVDRIVMLITNQPSIRDVILFPTMKPLDTAKPSAEAASGEPQAYAEAPAEASAETEAAAETPAASTFAGPATLYVDPATAGEPLDFTKVHVEPLFSDFVDFDTFSKSDFRAVKIKDCVEVPKSKKLLQFTLDDGTGTDRTILSGIKMYYKPEDLIGKTAIAILNLPPRKMMGIDSCGMLISAVHEEDGEEKLHLLMVDDHIPAGAKLY
ncbi:MAG: lysine--tRNA ligase [Eubacteriales bacterium]|nr:lysine--tRNA ligase [Eubacteriales bacterium]